MSRSGLYDWMVQRVSAVILAAYILFLLGFLIAHPGITYTEWHGLFSHSLMTIFSLLTLVSLERARMGRYVDAHDRLPDSDGAGPRPDRLRFLVQAVCGMAMFAFFVWGIQILWGN
ncbi:MAG: succinate dehydrogenase, hydrophobic membrane anchor protein [Pseudomonas sp.]